MVGFLVDNRSHPVVLRCIATRVSLIGESKSQRRISSKNRYCCMCPESLSQYSSDSASVIQGLIKV